MYENMKAGGELTLATKKQLFIVYGRKKDLDKLLVMKRVSCYFISVDFQFFLSRGARVEKLKKKTDQVSHRKNWSLFLLYLFKNQNFESIFATASSFTKFLHKISMLGFVFLFG